MARFIPASAGNTLTGSLPSAAKSVHPRVRGEHKIEDKRFVPVIGSSPRPRGTPCVRWQGRWPDRFIPASAGNTLPEYLAALNSAVHPRVRGEHAEVKNTPICGCGSSPRLRGTRAMEPPNVAAARFIPASAGNTSCRGRSRGGRTVHPRVCGEHQAEAKVKMLASGSSPRLRGTPSRMRCSWSHCSVHPRVRGEHNLAELEWLCKFGSSPRPRGTLGIGRLLTPPPRFIPASAGNTSHSWTERQRHTVHPRVRGEHGCCGCQSSMPRGSSPRPRGTRYQQRIATRLHRFIPASAGNTGELTGKINPCLVHPRVRGEHAFMTSSSSHSAGSSPRPRGTPPAPKPQVRVIRFIPASAGNTRAGP